MTTEKETCKNPWKENCNNTDIELYIQYKGEKLPICRECWTDLAESDYEWGDENVE